MKLVPEARKSWRWFSVQAMAAALVVQVAWLELPDSMRESLPEWFGMAVTCAVLALGIFGRLVDQEGREP